MEMEKSRPNNLAMTFDESSMEHSKSFVKALQELKNLRPQLYSAADYCEKSYLHSEQKQMVLDNLKDYAVRALVNAVDHLGTVASKLTDLFDRQNSDISTMDLKVSRLNQQLLTCRTFIDNEGFRQQQLLALIPRHHKNYILPNSVNKRVHFGPLRRSDTRRNLYRAISHLQPSDAPASKSLSWHLGSETKSTLKGTSAATPSSKDSKVFAKASGVFHLLENEESINRKPLGDPSQLSGRGPASTFMMQTYGVAQKDLEVPKPFTAHRSLANPRQEMIRTKSVLSAFFLKPKAPKLKATYV